MEDQKSMHKRWIQTTKALLYAREELCQPYSIPVVPDDLRKWNESAYMPKVVSIGPRYKGKKELLPMEEIKLRCIKALLSRTFVIDTIEGLLETIIDLDAAVRSCYVDVITLDRYELATTMVFDGCFLLELHICESKLDLEIPIPLNGISPGIQVKMMEYVRSDLMLLENQMPIFILETLFVKLLGNSNQMCEFIQNLALPFLGFSGKLLFKSTSHLLDSAYTHLEMGWMEKEIEEYQVRLYIGVIDSKLQEQHLNRCATRLEAVGITIQCLNNDDDINFKFATQFNKSNGILHIPTLRITKTTEVSWRNYIAWEHHKNKLNTSFSSVADRRSICTSSALLFRDLICCSSDVQLLKDRRVIVDHTNKSNRDLAAFFHSIASGVDRSIVDHTMFHALKAFRTKRFRTKRYFTKIFILVRHFFSSLDWRAYMLFASIVTILTFVQTCYTIIGYHFPK